MLPVCGVIPRYGIKSIRNTLIRKNRDRGRELNLPAKVTDRV
jgi:hypothetical protein